MTVLHSMRYLPIISPGSPKVRESPRALARCGIVKDVNRAVQQQNQAADELNAVAAEIAALSTRS